MLGANPAMLLLGNGVKPAGFGCPGDITEVFVPFRGVSSDAAISHPLGDPKSHLFHVLL